MSVLRWSSCDIVFSCECVRNLPARSTPRICDMTPDAIVNALSTLAVACWSAHDSDEYADAIDNDDDPDDVEGRTD